VETSSACSLSLLLSFFLCHLQAIKMSLTSDKVFYVEQSREPTKICGSVRPQCVLRGCGRTQSRTLDQPLVKRTSHSLHCSSYLPFIRLLASSSPPPPPISPPRRLCLSFLREKSLFFSRLARFLSILYGIENIVEVSRVVSVL